MALWNLGRLAEALLPCIDADTDHAVSLATDTLSRFDSIFGETYLSGWRRKLGLFSEGRTDTTLISRLLTMMHRDEADFTLTFRHLNTVARTDDATGFLTQFKDREAATSWLQSWTGRLDTEDQTADARFALMQASNPRIIPRNHRIEAAIKAALTGDYTLFYQLTAALARPFEDANDGLDLPPASNEHVRNTFCGT